MRGFISCNESLAGAPQRECERCTGTENRNGPSARLPKDTEASTLERGHAGRPCVREGENGPTTGLPGCVDPDAIELRANPPTPIRGVDRGAADAAERRLDRIS